jgi:hypothetical protein
MTGAQMPVPHVTITAVGATRSGKTTFLHGMYHVLSTRTFGGQSYSVRANTPDIDADLREAWLALRERGVMPKPTNDRPVTYDMTLGDSEDDLLTFSWTDYRGEAMNGRSDDPDHADTADLLARLDASDSIYVVVDGFAVRDPITPGNVLDVDDQVRAGRLSFLIGHALRSRRESGRPYPSLVVLVTKADMINTGDGGHEAVMERVVADVRQLLPPCFGDGTKTLVCPVELGTFGHADAEIVDPALVRPRWLHKPMLFSLMDYLFREHADYQAETENETRRKEEMDRKPVKKADLIGAVAAGAAVGTVAGFPGTGTAAGSLVAILRYRRKSKRKRDASKTVQARLDSRAAEAEHMLARVQGLVDEIATVPLFVDGVREHSESDVE